MMAVQRHGYPSAYVKPVAGLVAVLSLAMLAFGSGLAAIDHVTALAQRGTMVVPGSFNPQSHGDYRAAAPQRFAPQRATTR